MTSTAVWVAEHWSKRWTVLLLIGIFACLIVVRQAANPGPKISSVQASLVGTHTHPEFVSRVEMKGEGWYWIAMAVLANATVLGTILLGYGMQRGRVLANAKAIAAIVKRNTDADRVLRDLAVDVGVINTKLSMPDVATGNLAFHVEKLSEMVEGMRRQMCVLVGDRARQMSDTQVALDRRS